MSNQIDIVTEAMRAHADRLDGLASEAYQGVEAGRAVSTPGDAYGILCSFIGAAMMPAQATGIANAAVTVASIGATSTQVRAVAQIYDETDAFIADAMNVFRGQ